MKRKLHLVLLFLGAVAVCFISWNELEGSIHPKHFPLTNGPVKLTVLGKVKSDPIDSQQLSNHLTMLKYCRIFPGLRGFTNDAWIEMKNRSGRKVIVDGFNRSSPAYRLEYKIGNDWVGVETSIYQGADTPLSLVSETNLLFSAVSPAWPRNGEIWRVGVPYYVAPAMKQLRSGWNVVRSWVHLDPLPLESVQYIAWSQEIHE